MSLSKKQLENHGIKHKVSNLCSGNVKAFMDVINLYRFPRSFRWWRMAERDFAIF